MTPKLAVAVGSLVLLPRDRFCICDPARGVRCLWHHPIRRMAEEIRQRQAAPMESAADPEAAGAEFGRARDFIPGECWHCGASLRGDGTLCRGCEENL